MQQAIEIQLRVVGALVLRETRTRFGKTQLGYLWSFIGPIIHIIVMTFAFSALGRVAKVGDSLPLFFATGLLSFGIFRRISSQCATALEANQALLAYRIVKPLDAIIGRAVLEFLTSIANLIIIIAALIVFWEAQMPANLHLMAFAVILLAIIGFGIGALNAVIAAWWTSWRNIEQLGSRALILMSGVYLIPDALPEEVVKYLAWNPVLHGIELMRFGYYWGYRSSVLDVPYLVSSAVLLLFLGLAAERAGRFRGSDE